MKKKKKQESIVKPTPSLSQPTGNISNTPQYGTFIFAQHLLPILLISILALAIYANTLKNGFVYDDNFTIVNNSLIKNLRNLSKLVHQSYFDSSGELTYRPVVTFTYFVDYALYGQEPWGFHLTNILLHLFNGILLYIFLTLLLKRSNVCGQKSTTLQIFTNTPFIVSLMFVSHPVLTEAVNAISYREDLLSFLFYMGTLNIYLFLRSETSHLQRHRYLSLFALSYLYYFLALLSKEMALTLPLLIFCCEFIYRNKTDEKFKYILFNRYILGYIAITVIYIFIRFFLFQNPTNTEVPSWNLMERVLTVPLLIANYLKLTIFSASLSADYVFNPVKSVLSYRFLLPLLIVISLLLAAVKFWNRERGIAFGLLFFILTLSPVYNIVPLTNPFAERYLYTPVAGLILVIALAVHLFFESFFLKHLYKNIAVFAFIVMVLSAYSLLGIKRNTVWRDSFSLWSDTIIKTPDSSRAYNNLGLVYTNQGQLEESLNAFMNAIKLTPNFPEAHYNIGITYYEIGRLDEAIKEFLIALELKPKNPKAHTNLGNIYYRQGQIDEAIKEYQAALDQQPDFADAYYNLGLAYKKMEQLDNAIEAFTAAIINNINNSEAFYSLGTIYLQKGLFNKAMEQFQQALNLKPDANIYNAIGTVYLETGLLDEAMTEFQQAIRIKPDYSVANYNLGLVYWKKGEVQKAKEHIQSSLVLNPNFTEAQRALIDLKKNPSLP